MTTELVRTIFQNGNEINIYQPITKQTKEEYESYVEFLVKLSYKDMLYSKRGENIIK